MDSGAFFSSGISKHSDVSGFKLFVPKCEQANFELLLGQMLFFTNQTINASTNIVVFLNS